MLFLLRAPLILQPSLADAGPRTGLVFDGNPGGCRSGRCRAACLILQSCRSGSLDRSGTGTSVKGRHSVAGAADSERAILFFAACNRLVCSLHDWLGSCYVISGWLPGGLVNPGHLRTDAYSSLAAWLSSDAVLPLRAWRLLHARCWGQRLPVGKDMHKACFCTVRSLESTIVRDGSVSPMQQLETAAR
jgi:hypothetical protein